MIRRPPRSTLDRSSAASDVYKRQGVHGVGDDPHLAAGEAHRLDPHIGEGHAQQRHADALAGGEQHVHLAAGMSAADVVGCLLYTSDAADERSSVDLGGRRIIKKKTKQRPCD